jgi:hypothetical protein
LYVEIVSGEDELINYLRGDNAQREEVDVVSFLFAIGDSRNYLLSYCITAQSLGHRRIHTVVAKMRRVYHTG